MKRHKVKRCQSGTSGETPESGMVPTAAAMKEKMMWPEKQEASHREGTITG